jgi:hypothetical protein
MLRRINAAVFEGPEGARIEVVAQAQSNNGLSDARFEYAGTVLPRQTILGLPGCSFTVEDSSQRLQAVVAFDDNAPGNARYDLFEVENGVLSNLGKFTLKSDGSPLIAFVIDPVAAAVPARGPRRAPARAPRAAAAGARPPRPPRKRVAARKAAAKPPRRRTAKKTAKKSAKKTAARARRGSSRKRR